MPLPEWAPSTQDVALLAPAFTRGPWDDDDREHSGAEQGDFTEDTRPTRTQVEALIAHACDYVEGRAGVPIPERCHKLAKTAVIQVVAAWIASNTLPEQAEELEGMYRTRQDPGEATIAEVVRQARMPTALRIR